MLAVIAAAMVSIPPFLARPLADFLDVVVAAIPRLLSGLVFLALSYVVVRAVLALVRRSVGRVYVDDRELVGNLIVTVVAVFLWFAVALTFLKIVGNGRHRREPRAPRSGSSRWASRTRSPR